MNANDNDHDLWSDILEQLKLQTDRQVFEHLFARADGIIAGDTLTIAVPSQYILDTIQHRMRWIVEATASRVAGRRIPIAFIVSDDGESESEPEPEKDAETDVPADCRIAIEVVNFDITVGFVVTANYAWQYWQPYLSAVERENGLLVPVSFCLWNTLRSFPAAWQETGRPQWPSVETLADMAARGNRYKITGRNEYGQKRRHNRIVGALEILENEHIVWPRTIGTGRETVYYFRVLDSLPILTPAQIHKLSGRLQERHAREIERRKLDFLEWQQLTLPTLTALEDR